MKLIDKPKCGKPKAYTYLIKFDKLYYYGVRYGNIKLGLSPRDDLFKKYFTSSKYVAKLLEDKNPTEVIIHKVFKSVNSACNFEIKFLKRLNVKNRKDFLNQTDCFNNKHPKNLGRKLSDIEKNKISIASSKFQSCPNYKQKRKDMMVYKWSNPEYKEFMKEKNNTFKNSKKGKEHYKNRKQSFSGKRHTKETKEKMSKPRGKYKNIKYYKCPFCSKNTTAGNLSRHIHSNHNKSMEESKLIFKGLKNLN